MNAVTHDTAVNLAAHPIAWPLARLARRVGGVIDVPGLGLVVSDAEFGHEVLVRPDDFTKNGPGSLASQMTQLLGPFALGNMDGDAHQRLRGKLSDIVTPARAREFLQASAGDIESLQRRLRAGETVDLCRWMRALSGHITYDMLGIEPAGGLEEKVYEDVVLLGEQISRGVNFIPPSPSRLARLKVDADTLIHFARRGYEAPDAPATSFIRRLRDLGLSFDEARGVIGIIFLAGTLTTAAAVPRIVALLHDSGALPQLARDRAALASAISEGLRFISPVPATARIAARATTVQGRAIPANKRIVILTCNMARDPKLFDDPDRFDASRPANPRARNLWFGAGPHFCLGFAVAQLEIRMVLEALLDLGDTLRIVKRTVASNVLVPSYQRLDVRLEGAG